MLFPPFLLSLDRKTKLNIDLRADLLKTWTKQEKELFAQRYELVEKVNTG